MLLIINLYGTHKGFLRIRDGDAGCFVQGRGIPDGARVFLLTAPAFRAVEIHADEALNIRIRDIRGALALLKTDGSWSIIMQGTVRGQLKIPDSAKRALWTELNRPAPEAEQPARKPSEALRGILDQAEELFSDKQHEQPRKTEKTPQPTNTVNKSLRQNNTPQSRVFNPFSKTYPHSSWQRRRFRNGVMLEGTFELAGEKLFMQAIPSGFFSDDQSFEKMGFTRFVRDDSGRGYRLRMKYLPKPHLKNN